VDIVTVDSIVATTAAKRDLHAATGAAIVDMETHAVAAAAAAATVPCASVRIVSDGAGDELPADLARLVTPQSAFRRAGAALAAIGRKPAAAGTMWRLWENAVVDGRALAAALERLVAALPEA
jgi:adenosylhomocysteine nucleosidase